MKAIILFAVTFFTLQSTYSQNIYTYAGNGNAGYSGDGGPAINAQLNYVAGIAFDRHGNLYISDSQNSRVRKVNLNGIISTFAGTGIPGYSGDNGPAANAQINEAHDVAFDSKGNLYISDFGDNRIRKIDTAGVITTYAGNGTSGVSGDSGLAILASIGTPDNITFDSHDNLYISQGNDYCVRKVDTMGIITTIAGVPSNNLYNGDSIPAVTANLNFPAGLACDAHGKLFIAEIFGARIRMVDTSGIIYTIAGTGTQGYNGDGIPAINAQIQHPLGLAVDHVNSLVFADGYNNRIRKINPAGIITTIAGNGTAGFSGDSGLAINARLDYPFEITFSNSGLLYIADDFNDRVRVLSDGITNAIDIIEFNSFSIFPNPVLDILNVASSSNSIFDFSLYSIDGKMLLSRSSSVSFTVDMENYEKGIYIYRAFQNGEVFNGKIIKQ